MLKIGEFSKLSRISVRMLRHYDEIGLLHPAETDPFSGYRYYSEAQLNDAARIKALRDIGFGLSDIGALLRSLDDEAQTARYFAIRKKQLLAEAAETAYRLQLLDTAGKWLRKDKLPMNYNVSIKTFPSYKAACLRTVLPSYEAEGMAWGILMQETEPMALVPDDPCLCSVVFYDSEYKESDVDIEIRKSVRGDYKDTEHVKFKTVEAVTVASSIHNGSYRGLDAAMGQTAQWVEDNGYAFDGNAFLIYHVSPHETQNPDEFVTEICYPVRKLMN